MYIYIYIYIVIVPRERSSHCRVRSMPQIQKRFLLQTGLQRCRLWLETVTTVTALSGTSWASDSEASSRRPCVTWITWWEQRLWTTSACILPRMHRCLSASGWQPRPIRLSFSCFERVSLLVARLNNSYESILTILTSNCSCVLWKA